MILIIAGFSLLYYSTVHHLLLQELRVKNNVVSLLDYGLFHLLVFNLSLYMFVFLVRFPLKTSV